jgi:hypothetical protein
VVAVGVGVEWGVEGKGKQQQLPVSATRRRGLESRNGRPKTGFHTTRLGSGVEPVAMRCAPVKGCICLVLGSKLDRSGFFENLGRVNSGF